MEDETKRVQNQTNEEWLNEYNGVSNSATQDVLPPKNNLFRYIDHRTTSSSSVVLEFEGIDRPEKAVKFFNVSLSGRKSNYPAKNRGQFNPSERGNFRKFWMQAVGEPPSRWSRVHKSMRSHLRKLVFVGETKVVPDGKGKLYTKLTSIQAQTSHE